MYNINGMFLRIIPASLGIIYFSVKILITVLDRIVLVQLLVPGETYCQKLMKINISTRTINVMETR